MCKMVANNKWKTQTKIERKLATTMQKQKRRKFYINIKFSDKEKGIKEKQNKKTINNKIQTSSVVKGKK